MLYTDLLLKSGSIVRIEYKDSDQDDILETVDNCIRRGDPIPLNIREGQSATLNGIMVDRVYPHQVEAML